MTAPYPRLVADIGGTNTRFGWIDQPGASIDHVRVLPADDHAGVADAVRAYLRKAARPAPAALAMGVATPITGDAVQLTNRPSWSFSIGALQAELGLQRLLVLNDFTALALALPTLAASDVRQVGGGRAAAGSAIGLIGPGTGLGVSGLLPVGNGWAPIAGEGGHVTLAAVNDREAAVIAHLQQRYGHASGERALCGAGLVALYESLCALDDQPAESLDPATVCQRGLAGEAPCAEAIALFCSMLGTLAGNLALTLGARGGVYVGGGIVPRLGQAFDRSPFRARFEAKGRYRGYLQAIPTFVIDTAVSPALAGAAQALDQD